ncbi:MAG: hypothetical protein DHS80DRAFT_23082 [Piptocephalis tieghemiana]|nr:MAG: hypothetical protein DHS80DRAFT_23082 [Piptocephalis tieghemiana]
MKPESPSEDSSPVVTSPSEIQPLAPPTPTSSSRPPLPTSPITSNSSSASRPPMPPPISSPSSTSVRPPPPPSDAPPLPPAPRNRPSRAYSDFRGAGHAEDGHWNDPPKDAAGVNGVNDPLETEEQREAMNERITLLLTTLTSAPSTADLPPKRAMDDMSKRLGLLKDRIHSHQLGPQTATDLTSLINAVEEGKWEEAGKVHARMIQEVYEQEGKWLPGMKRLIESLKKVKGEASSE